MTIGSVAVACFAASAAGVVVAPVHPHFGQKNFLDQPLKHRLEHTGRGRQAMPMR